MKMLTPADTGTLTVEGHEYTPDADGHIIVAEGSHVELLTSLGCTDPAATPPAPVAAAEPPAVPEGMVDPEVVRALIDENEQLKSDLQAANSRAGGLETDLVAAKTEIALRTGENDQLRDRIQELEGLAAAAAERAAETAEGKDDALQAIADENAVEKAPPAVESPIKEVDGITVSDPEAFDAMEYNPLKEWLKVHGVHVPAGIKKVDAVIACKTRFVELTTPAA